MKGERFLFVIHDNHEKNNPVPLGPAYIAHALRENGIDVTFFCQDVYHQTDDELKAFIIEAKFDFVGMGFLAARFNRIQGTLKAIRESCTETGAIMILGGHGPSSALEYMIEHTGADIVVVGEGEKTVVDLVDAVRNKGSFSSVHGIVWRTPEGKIMVNPPRALIRELDSISFPAYDLLPMDIYTKFITSRHVHDAHGSKNAIVGFIITGRGCLGQCSFCYRMNKGLRTRNMTSVAQEIIMLHNTYGVNHLCIFDETMGSTEKMITDLCNTINKLPFRLRWTSSVRVDMLQDTDIVNRLAESGCVYLSLGLESLNQRVIDLMGKRTTVKQNYKAVENCIKAGINPGLNLIWGCPGDTIETLWEQVEFINKMNTGTECRTIRPVTPYPGSALYYDAIAEGKLQGPGDFFNKCKNSDYITVNFTEIPIERMLEELYKANCSIIDAFCNHPKVKEGGEYFSTDSGRMKKLFYDLYFNGYYEFRGVR